ncbi:nucleoside hydrolase [Dactylosporangium vinaceum]|uniref:Nucleoside hydrolase n=1 Tax=Dactylosporangium vinaceum TaxID=53362 RepID=A0ABV5MCD6_9ACTN|nr:nucleoside hydrolase [Dactylosporangium vinaceum]UAB92152.1 nucleoside hydrolase [Dactylosporangium vinaceum]
MDRQAVVWDMETGDPDDFITLLLLAGHPAVDLRAVTVTPGTAAQIGVVRHGLRLLGRDDVRVGAGNLDHPRDAVSPWHYQALGPIGPNRDAEPAARLLAERCTDDTTLICGGPLKNLGQALHDDRFRLGRLVVQGGFAGDGVVPRARQLEKFKGRTTCPSFNLNGAPKAVFAALASPAIRERWFVSKNVCHGVAYDEALHARFGRAGAASLTAIRRLMGDYLREHPGGKLFHDPLAACCALDPGIGEWAEVEIYRERGEWGARPRPGSGTRIIVGYDHERFVATLLAERPGRAAPPSRATAEAGAGVRAEETRGLERDVVS